MKQTDVGEWYNFEVITFDYAYIHFVFKKNIL